MSDDVYIAAIVFLCLIDSFLCGPSTDYCSLSCGYKHTVCKRNNRCGPVSGCQNIESTYAFREYMVNEHNKYRNDIASAKVTEPYNNKGATNMNALSYDMEMEYIAACWANLCGGLKHDVCRSSSRFSAGQNIFWGSNSNETEKGILSWYGEIKHLGNPDWISRFPKAFPADKKQRGHFTQVIWAETKYVGCARVRYGKRNIETMLICNYGPAGNVVGMSVYKMAADSSQIASQCKGGINSEYSSLCGSIDPTPTEKQWAQADSSKICSLIFYFSFINLFIAHVNLK